MQSDPTSRSATSHVPAEPAPDAPTGAPAAPHAPADPTLNGQRSKSVLDEQPSPQGMLQEAPAEVVADAPEAARTEVAPSPTSEQIPPPPRARYNPLRYWLRPLVLAVLVVFLLGLTYWDQRRVPDRPVAPDVLTATPQANGTVSSSDPGLVDTMDRLRTALQRRDARALANLSDPDGLIVAPFGGTIPDTGFKVTDTYRFSQDALNGAQLQLLGWRNDGRGHVIVLADGWKERPLRLAANDTLNLTALTGIGLVSRAGTWYVRWFLPDPNGVLAQQARSLVWQR